MTIGSIIGLVVAIFIFIYIFFGYAKQFSSSFSPEVAEHEIKKAFEDACRGSIGVYSSQQFRKGEPYTLYFLNATALFDENSIAYSGELNAHECVSKLADQAPRSLRECGDKCACFVNKSYDSDVTSSSPSPSMSLGSRQFKIDLLDCDGTNVLPYKISCFTLCGTPTLEFGNKLIRTPVWNKEKQLIYFRVKLDNDRLNLSKVEWVVWE